MLRMEIVRAGDWWFRVIAKNGKTLCHSEQYKRRIDAVKAAKSVIKCKKWSFKILP